MKWVCLFAMLLAVLSVGYAGYQLTIVPNDQVVMWQQRFTDKFPNAGSDGSWGDDEMWSVPGDAETRRIKEEFGVVGESRDGTPASGGQVRGMMPGSRVDHMLETSDPEAEPQGGFKQKQRYDIDVEKDEDLEDTKRKQQGLDDAKKKVDAVF